MVTSECPRSMGSHDDESMAVGIMPSGASVPTGLVLILTAVLAISQTPFFLPIVSAGSFSLPSCCVSWVLFLKWVPFN